MSTREPIFAALFALGQTITWADPITGAPTVWGYSNRRIQTSDQISADAMPAFLQGVGPEQVVAKSGYPSKRTLSANWLIYYKPYTNPASTDPLTNAILDGVDFAMQPDDSIGNVLTLGGLVTHAWIEGEVFKAAGDMNEQAMIVVPIKLLVP
jgi:hypothetical protein